MKTIYIFFINMLLPIIMQAQSPIFKWAKSFKSIDYATAYGMAIDQNGNVYTTGAIKGTTDFDPNSGIANFTALGSGEDVFISKLDSNGNYIWAISFGSNNCYDKGHSIKVTSNGDVIVIGDFTGAVDFDPGAGIASLTNYGSSMFIARYTSAGNFVWAKKMDASNYGNYFFEKFALDKLDNIYLTASFDYSFDADPNAGILNLSSISLSTTDVFIAKLSGNGNLIWAKQFAHTVTGSSSMYAHSLVVDAECNVYSTGVFDGTVDFDPGAGINSYTNSGGFSGPDTYISKLDSNGNFVYAKKLPSVISEKGTTLDIDAFKNVIIGGRFEGTKDFDPGAGVFNMTTTGFSNTDIFLVKLDSIGAFVWAKQIGNALINEQLNSIYADQNNNIYLTGEFKGTVDFNPDATAVYNLNATNIDAFIAKLNPNGNLLWAEQITGDSIEYGRAIELDNNKNIYTLGGFNDSTDFDNDTNANFIVVPQSTYREPFIHKMKEKCDVDISVSVTGFNFTAIQANATYQWLKCDEPLLTILNGATNQTYTAASSGNYAVIVSNGNCKDTSACISTAALSINNIENQFCKIYPNPNTGVFIIDAQSKAIISITNVTGQSIGRYKIQKGLNTISMQSSANGIYYIRIDVEGQIQNYKMVINKN
jgi:hypothetical protein